MPFPPTFDHAWDLTQPPDTQAANLLGQDIRNLKDDVMQRLSLLSGTLANRPTPETVNATWGGSGFGLLFFATDTSQIFQWNGSAWVQVFFNGLVVATVDLLAQSAAIASTLLYTTVKSGIYTLGGEMLSNTSGTSGNAQTNMIYNNGVIGQTQLAFTSQATDAPGTPAADFFSRTFGFFVPAGQNINYSVVFNSIVGAYKFDLHLRISYLG